MAEQSIRLLLLSDPVADHRWMATLTAAFPDSLCPVWPVGTKGEMIANYAQRCVEEWQQSDPSLFQPDIPLVIAGIGFGSPFAIEIAAHLKRQLAKDATVLIVGGIRSREMIPMPLKLQWPIVNWLPKTMLGPWIRKHWFGIPFEWKNWNPELRELSRSLLTQLSIGRFRQVASSIIGWDLDRTKLDGLGMTIHQLHGRLDRVIACPSVQDATILLHGEHLLHISHPGEVHRWMEAMVRNLVLAYRHRKS